METRKQPVGLMGLFFVEFWERFGFYAVQGLIVLYLTKFFNFDDTRAYLLSSAYAALLYAMTILGGIYADRKIGFKKAIVTGSALYIVGYFILAFFPTTLMTYLALALLIAGCGFFKPNVSSLLGTLYTDKDPRRDAGYTIFYMGINVGSALATIICPVIAFQYGWHWAFVSADIGIIIGLITFLIVCTRIQTHHAANNKVLEHHLSMANPYGKPFYVALPLIVYGLFLILKFPASADLCLWVFGAAGLAIVFYVMIKLDKPARHKIIALLILFLFSISFWALYQQLFMSLTLFAERNVHRVFFGYTIQAASLQGINPMTIILLSLPIASLWNRLGNRMSVASKFALALLLTGGGFLVLAGAIHFFSVDGYVSVLWLIISIIMMTLGELFLSPVGLSATSSLSPPQYLGLMMGLWFLTTAAGISLAGHLASWASIPVEFTNQAVITGQYYFSAFLRYGLITVTCGIIFLFVIPSLTRLINNSNQHG